MKRQSEERHRLLEAARQLQGEILPALLAEVEARRLTVVGAAALLGVNHSVVSGMISRARRRAERSLDAARLATAADLEAAERRLEGI